MPQLSRRGLVAKLRNLLSRARIEYCVLPNGTHALSEWEDGGGTIHIKIDPAKDGDIPCVIHELIHVALEAPLRQTFDSELEEVAVAALEAKIVQTLSARSTKWWRAEIQRRVR